MLREASAEIEPAAFTQALIQAAETRGARVEHARVSGLSLCGRSVAGVRLESDDLVRTETVVLAMGPWTSAAAEWIGSRVPVSPLKGQILRLRLPPAAAETRFSDTDGNYMARKADGLVYVGTTEERAGFDETPTAAARRPHPAPGRPLRLRGVTGGGGAADGLSAPALARRFADPGRGIRSCPAHSSPRGMDARACCSAREAPPPWPPRSPANPPPST